MTIRPVDNNLTLRVALDQAAALMDKNGWLNHSFVVETALTKQYPGLHNVLTMIRPDEGNSHNRKLEQDFVEYDQLVLVRERIQASEIWKKLEKIHSDGKLVVSGREAKVQSGGFWSSESCAGGNLYDSRACLVVSKRCDPAYGTPYGPLVSYSYPYFNGAVEAISAFFGIDMRNENDSRINHLFLIVPDRQANFESMKMEGGDLVINVAGSLVNGHDLRLKGQAALTDGVIDIDIDLQGGKASIPVRPPLKWISVWLVGKPDYKYDHYFEPVSYGPARSFNVCDQLGNSKSESAITSALETGECETVEYKPFVKLDNPKVKEVIKTIVAFTNTRGGKIILGIDDEAQVEGIEKELRASTSEKSKSLEKLVSAYITALKERVNHAIHGNLSIEYHAVNYANHRLLVIDVAPSSQGPVNLIEGNVFYVRKGANSVPPNAADLARFFERGNVG